MPQLDKLLAAMMANHASALVLTDGEVVKLEIGAQLRPLTKTPLSTAQILTLLEEVATPHDQAALASGSPVEILRATPDGAFVIKGQVVDGKWRAVVSIGKSVPESKPERPAPDASPGIKRPHSPLASPIRTPTPIPVSAGGAREGATGPEAIGWFAGIDDARSGMEALLGLLVQRGATDLHLRAGEPPILRHDRQLLRVDGHASLTDPELSDMLRSIMTDRVRADYIASNDVDFSYEIDGLARFRLNAARDRNGVIAVIRELPPTVVSTEQVKVSAEVQRLCFLPKGVVLLSGHRGSGRTATMCALVDLMNRERSVHIVTIEDPIEFVHKSRKAVVTQRQVGIHTRTAAGALRAALREDPDVIVVGELRDPEMISLVLEAADGGHLVFATVRAATAAGTIERLTDQYSVDRQPQARGLLAESLKGVVSQTLCKRIGGGHVAAREIMLSTPSITNLIRDGKTSQIPSLLQASRKLGMISLNDALVAYVDAGEVDAKEAYAKCADKTGMAALLKTRGIDMSFAEGDHAAAAGPPAGAPTPGNTKTGATPVRR